MKKLSILIAIFIASTLGISFAYNPTTGDLETITQLKNILDQTNSGNVKDIRNFSTQIKKLLPMVSHDQRISYILKELYNHLY